MAVSLVGKFDSHFKDKESPLAKEGAPKPTGDDLPPDAGDVLKHSTPDARLQDGQDEQEGAPTY